MGKKEILISHDAVANFRFKAQFYAVFSMKVNEPILCRGQEGANGVHFVFNI
jgi:hypothetical protein